MLKTTALVAEMLVGGVIFLLSMLFLLWTLFPQPVGGTLETLYFSSSQSKASSQSSIEARLFLLLLFLPVSYTFGIFVEFTTRMIFERRLKGMSETSWLMGIITCQCAINLS